MMQDRAQMLSLYIDGALNDQEMQVFEAWLADDPNLRQELENMQMMLAELAELPQIDMPSDVRRNAMAKIQQERQEKRRKMPKIWHFGGLAAAAAVVAILVFGTDFWPDYASITSVVDEAEERANFRMPHVPGATGVVPNAAFTAELSESAMDFEVVDSDLSLQARSYGWNMHDMDMEMAMSATPVAVGQTLEEIFDDMARRQVYTGALNNFTSTTAYPRHLPTDNIIFHTPERFAISFDIRIAVEDVNTSQVMVEELPGQIRDAYVIFEDSDSGRIFENSMAFDFEELEQTFISLYGLGIVEEYRLNVTDTWASGNDWETDGVVNVTLVESRP
ncbi:MAG: hypothetical protein FWC93_00460 [Defluviitaleaceae bacterium]|nr:hypothetical protein [Defluviitaleaceae bacterium]